MLLALTNYDLIDTYHLIPPGLLCFVKSEKPDTSVSCMEDETLVSLPVPASVETGVPKHVMCTNLIGCITIIFSICSTCNFNL